MGFKCPQCRKDFGRNRQKWIMHIYLTHPDLSLKKEIENRLQQVLPKGDK